MALERLGIKHEVVGIFEIDKYAIQSYESIFDKTLNLGDITKVDVKDVPDCDLFTYSFPCQDISVAGKLKGLDKNSNTRSGLLWDCEKIIREKKPKYLLMENVKNLVGKKFKSDFEEWLKILENMGYTNYWEILNAKDYGVPQNRERVFCVSILGEHTPYKFPEKFPLKLRMRDLLENTVDEKFYLSQEQINKIKFSTYETNKRRIQEKDWCDTLCARDFKDPKCVKINQIGQHDTEKRKNTSIFRVYDDNGLAPSLTTMGGGNTEPHVIDDSPKLVGGIGETNFGTQYRQGNRIYDSENIAMALQTSPVGNIGGNSYLYKVVCEERRDEGLRFFKDNNCGTIRTINSGGDKRVIESNNQDFRVRKLTPKECWRLMGIKDGDFEKAQKVCSNTQLYKQAGNAIVVDVLVAIFNKLFLNNNKI